MAQFTIKLPDLFIVTSRGIDATVPLGTLSAEIIAELAQHGLTQKVADAASNAKAVAEETKTDIGEVTLGLMSAAVESLVKGEWTRRTGGGRVDERTRVARSIVQAAYKTKVGAKSPEYATFTGLSDADQNEKLDAWFAANEETFGPTVDAEVKARADKRDAKAKLAKKVTFDL